jgi:hypothetical protein
VGATRDTESAARARNRAQAARLDRVRPTESARTARAAGPIVGRLGALSRRNAAGTVPPMQLPDYEKLGVFYLGAEYDLAARARRDALVLYDSQHLTTHAVCVGMTGSGKTGLCIGLLEEAAIDGIPAIVIDPKGDLANLLLQFPALAPGDFEPWIDPEEARRAGQSPAQAAAETAARWRAGLAEWHQGPERIARLAQSAEFRVYTPGSSAGIPVSILRSFDAPPAALAQDAELFAERVSSTATALLGLVGLDVDPLQSREHILVANVLDRAWRAGRGLDLSGLIGAIQAPGVQRIGVFELEAFFPAQERFQLALRLNNLLASPAFAAWMEGEPLDVGAALRAPAGKPRVSIFSIAHLGERERMFFVSLLLNQVLAWMRTQSGTSSLRAILYMDEIAGYFPPVQNPPSKPPLLTLLKQGRAFGLGVVLATQNPVDLDYKGLANCGTWFVGRLQTERDKARLLDGLEGAAPGAFERAEMERTLSALGKRVFLLHDVHAAAPRTFQTRWTLSYLRGPLARAELERLKTARSGSAPAAPAPAVPALATPALAAAPAPAPVAPEPPTTPAGPAHSASLPVLPPEIPQLLLPAREAAARALPFRPALFASARVYFSDARLGVAAELPVNLLAPLALGPVALEWGAAQRVAWGENALTPAAPADARFAELPAAASKPKSYEVWRRALADHLAQGETLVVWKSSATRLVSQPFESERDFRLRCEQRARERRDEAKDKLRAKYASKRAAAEERVRRAEHALAREGEQAREAKVGSAISFGSALLGALLGKRAASAASVGRAATAARSAGRAYKQSGDVGRAGESWPSSRRASRPSCSSSSAASTPRASRSSRSSCARASRT